MQLYLDIVLLGKRVQRNKLIPPWEPIRQQNLLDHLLGMLQPMIPVS